MKPILTLPLLAFACAGCLLSSSPVEESCWNVEATELTPIVSACPTNALAGAVTRLAAVSVRAPFDASNFLVQRDDGTLAYDPCNAFPAPPPSLLRGPTVDLMRACQCFGKVLPFSSIGRNNQTIEVEVSRLLLDCREGRREAVVEVFVTLYRQREPVRTVFGRSRSDARTADYSTAFSTAYTQALREAFAQF